MQIHILDNFNKRVLMILSENEIMTDGPTEGRNDRQPKSYTAQLKFSTDFNMMPHFECT